MRIVLTSSSVAYHFLTLVRAQSKNFPLAPTELQIQMPAGSIEAANAGATIKFGQPDSIATPTDVPSPNCVFSEEMDRRWQPPAEANSWYVKGSANSVVLYIDQ